jgi:hypothetical protein
MSTHKNIFFHPAGTFDHLVHEMEKTGKEPFEGFRAAAKKYQEGVRAAHAIVESGNYPNANPNANTPEERKRKDCIERGYAMLRKFEATRKDIVAPFTGKRHVNVHYLVGYCPQTIAAYQEMANSLRKDFPNAKDKDIGCHQVTKSNCVYGFTLITWQTQLKLPAGKREAELMYPGWSIYEDGNCDYSY